MIQGTYQGRILFAVDHAGCIWSNAHEIRALKVPCIMRYCNCALNDKMVENLRWCSHGCDSCSKVCIKVGFRLQLIMQDAYDRMRTKSELWKCPASWMLQLCTNVENVEIYDDVVKLCLMIQGTCQGRISIAVDHAGSIWSDAHEIRALEVPCVMIYCNCALSAKRSKSTMMLPWLWLML